jgi:chorismate mutase
MNEEDQIDMMHDSHALWQEIDRLRAELAQRTAERDALAAEVAAIKANDPLAEMWRELSEYQPMADADGYGEAWRIMCRERTARAAERAHDVLLPASSSSSYAPWLAALSARWAIEWEETSRRNVREAIDSIRRAKEAKP